MHELVKRGMAIATAVALTFLPAAPAFAQNPGSTRTPIQHIVVIFQENISFDHYFGTYPNATNPPNEPPFFAKPGTPTVNGYSPFLLNANPNSLNAANAPNGTGAAVNPFRLDRSAAVTNDQNHAYTPEQAAADNGLLDLFPLHVGNAGPPPNAPPQADTKGLTMGYYDGNTVTAFWNYAQEFALSDNSYGSTFGPSTVGLLNLVAGQTNGVATIMNGTGSETPDGSGGLTVIDDPDPYGDACANPARNQVQMVGQNIGDLLSAAGVSWGSFMGGFNITTATNSNGTVGCGRTSTGLAGNTNDYIPHHAMFQYHAGTTNPTHARPASIAEIGNKGAANHEYDLQDFYAAVSAGNFPAVNFLKAIAIQDGHAGYSDPLDEQQFVVTVVNFLQHTPYWRNTAVVVAYDDSDGWYDHQMGPIVNQSASPADALTGPGACGNGINALPGANPATTPNAQGRCGYGPRLPMLVISPWAKSNFVDHRVTDQSSIIHFIEDNWLGGQRLGPGSFDAQSNSIDGMFDFNHFLPPNGYLILDPNSGEPVPFVFPGW